MLRCHVTRIREALQAVRAEPGDNSMQLSAKTELQGEDSLEVEPLVSRVEERLESLKSLPIFGLEKGQKYSLFMGQVHNGFIINTTFI